MMIEITIFRFVVRFSLFIFREKEPPQIESAVFYNLMINKKGNIVKIPRG